MLNCLILSGTQLQDMKITQSLTSSEVRLLIQKSSDGCFIHSLLCLFTHLICTNLYLTFCWRTGAVGAWLRSFPPYCKGIGRTYACIPAFLAFLPVQLVSTVLQSESAVHRHVSPPSWRSFPFRSLHSIEQGSLCYTRCPHQLSTLYSVNGIKVSTPSPNSSYHLPSPWHPYFCFLCLYFCFANMIIYTIFPDFYMH